MTPQASIRIAITFTINELNETETLKRNDIKIIEISTTVSTSGYINTAKRNPRTLRTGVKKTRTFAPLEIRTPDFA